jgi:hypothetical protein
MDEKWVGEMVGGWVDYSDYPTVAKWASEKADL